MVYISTSLGWGVFKGVTSTFSPTDISGLQLWLDASDTSTITETSGSVSQWDDKSGNGRNVSQSTGSSQPTTGVDTINSLNVISATVNEFLENNNFSVEGNDGLTIFTVTDGYNMATNLFEVALALKRLESPLPGGTFSYSMRGARSWYGNGNTAHDINSTSPEIVAYIYPDSGNHDSTICYLGGSAVARGNITNPSNSINLDVTSILVGNNVPSNTGFDIKYGEVIVYYGRDLTNSEINQIGNYLSDKWGIAWTDVQ